MKDKYKVCSLFAGIGGIDLAFQQAGFEIVWANELDSEGLQFNIWCKIFKIAEARLYILFSHNPSSFL